MINEKFNKPYNPKEIEEKIYKTWEESGFFAPEAHPFQGDNPNKGKTFVIPIPPPNVTGTLHLGHALNAVIQDILIRKKRMEGYKTLWIPGTDHAGIATQNVVEKQLKKEGLSRHDLGREKFLEKAWEWKEKYGHIILDQFKKLGCSMDWSRTRFTMDKDYQEAVKQSFLHYYQKGWIYQAERVINWCPRCATSLSDLEVEYQDSKSKLWFIKYSPEITVATTRPETMLGDTAVAVHPYDKQYKNLIGKKVLLPIQKRKIPIIADRRVDPKFGTGAVKVTPAHSFTDYEISQEHNLPMIKAIGLDGKMTKEAGKNFVGLTILQAREKIIQELEKQRLIEKVEDYNNYIGHCYRCGTIIEPIPSLQWFLKIDELARMAIAAVKSGAVKFHPKRWEKIYFDWLKNVKDWCISRQIWWGHKIPLDGVDDVLDTWFSSALWPFATLGWPDKNNKDLKEFYPTQVLSTARDIINLWVARMVFSGMEFMGKEPFSDVIIHATILTKEGKRMSKSLGTGIDPMHLIEKYGADATRFGLIWQAMGGQDIHWAEEHVMAGKKFANKIWNAARFVLSNSQVSEDFLPEINQSDLINELDKKIVESLKRTKKEIVGQIDNFEFGQALHLIYDFFWHQFCDEYIENSKKQLNTKVLGYILISSLKLLHPFMPFITEEIWRALPLKDKKILIIEQW
jgi:valyl-tRNA synthetase